MKHIPYLMHAFTIQRDGEAQSRTIRTCGGAVGAARDMFTHLDRKSRITYVDALTTRVGDVTVTNADHVLGAL